MRRRCFCKCFAGAMAVSALGCRTPTSGAFLEVNEQLCIGCGACVTVCDGDAITVLDRKAVIDPTKCVECGKCVKVCPYDAIQ